MTTVSVVMPTYNRLDRLKVALGALADQTAVGDVEVVVVSDGSTDGTAQWLECGPLPIPVRPLLLRNRGVAAARNAGVAAATGELIVFLDDDVVAEPDCLATHVAAHARAGDDAVVIGPLLTPPAIRLEPWVKWEQLMLTKQYDDLSRGRYRATARQFYTGNVSLPRQLFERAGGFDESFRRAEDVELAYRLHDLGATFHFEFDARAFHHASRSYQSWLETAAAYGRNDVRFWRDKGQKWLLPTIRAEYGRRNPLNRTFTRLGLAVPAVGTTTRRVAPHWATLVDRVGLAGSGRRLLSAVYNLTYYAALTDEIGGLDRFLSTEPEPPC